MSRVRWIFRITFFIGRMILILNKELSTYRIELINILLISLIKIKFIMIQDIIKKDYRVY